MSQITREEMQRARKALDLTQAEIAEILGVSRMTYYRWKTGESRPPAHMKENLEILIRAAKRPGKALLFIDGIRSGRLTIAGAYEVAFNMQTGVMDKQMFVDFITDGLTDKAEARKIA
ncbi:helix-turn-helix domain-containing protein [bacterium]|nr:helix-turn-helix domain-containing protein [bacterium]